MRTTVDLPPEVHRRVKELAVSRGGFPVLSIGRIITTTEVADLMDEK